MSEYDEEEAQESQLGGVIHREYWGWNHKKCILYCRDENHYHKQKRDHRACQNCYGGIVIRSIQDSDVPPEPGFFMRMTAWFDAWCEVRRRALEELEDRRWNAGRWRRWSEPCDNCAGPRSAQHADKG